MTISGIYKISNSISEKFYIGSAVNIKIRFKGHKYKLRHNSHSNIKLQASWNLHGEEAFEFIILEYCEKQNLIEREQYWIDKLEAVKFGYNINKFANSRLGMLHTNETKLKFKSLIRSKEHKEKLKIARLGTKHTEETKAKMSKSHKGKMSEGHKDKLKAAAKTPERRNALRLARLGKIGNRKSEKWPHAEGHWRCICDLCKAQRNEYSKLNLRKNRAKRKIQATEIVGTEF